jgi:hypothetical protein
MHIPGIYPTKAGPLPHPPRHATLTDTLSIYDLRLYVGSTLHY